MPTHKTKELNCTFAAVDLETANLSRYSACAIGVVLVENGRKVDEAYYLIRPPSKIFRFSDIHGIKYEDVHDAGDFRDVWPEIRHLFKAADFLVAHNASFDQAVLAETMSYHGMRSHGKRFACTARMAKQQWGLKSVALPVLCESMKIPLNHHDALSDARACAKIAIKGLRRGWSPLAK